MLKTFWNYSWSYITSCIIKFQLVELQLVNSSEITVKSLLKSHFTVVYSYIKFVLSEITVGEICQIPNLLIQLSSKVYKIRITWKVLKLRTYRWWNLSDPQISHIALSPLAGDGAASSWWCRRSTASRRSAAAPGQLLRLLLLLLLLLLLVLLLLLHTIKAIARMLRLLILVLLPQPQLLHSLLIQLITILLPLSQYNFDPISL